MKKINILILFLILFNYTKAQEKTKTKFRHFSVDVYGGLPIVYGDIKNEFFGYNVTGRLNWNMTSAVSIGGEFSYGNVIGQKEKYQEDYFINTYMKAMLGGEVYLFNVFKFNELSKWFQPFIGLNVGAIKSNIELSGNKFGLNNKHYNDWDFAHQWHLGTKFKLAKWLDLNARYSLVFIQTDEFDNFIPNTTENKYNDALTNIDLGFTFHFGAKGTDAIIWKLPNDQNDDLVKKSDYDKLVDEMDSISKSIDNNNKTIDETKNALEESDKQNKGLELKVEELQNKIDDFSANATSPSGNYNSGNNEEYIYVANLQGPINAAYYIVSGSYAIYKNATNRVSYLKNLGYSPVIMKETQADLNRVVIDSSNDLEDIKQKKEKYRIELDPNAWIIQQR